jgi:catalase
MILNRNVDNFFAETEQVAFHPGHVVPGIDVSNDPLLQGRLFSYLDTQLTRLGGPNFAEIPINRPIAPVHNNQRDGMHRMAIDRGQVAYSPNSLQENTPQPDAQDGYKHYQEKVEGKKTRERSESFKDFYSQAALFWNSMSKHEKKRIIRAFHFEVGNVMNKDVRKRVVEVFNNVDGDLAKQIAAGVGVAPPDKPGGTGVKGSSPAVSVENTTFDARTRKVAVLVENGFNYAEYEQVMDALIKAGVVTEVVSKHQGTLTSTEGRELEVDKNHLTTGSIKYDAVYIPGGRESVDSLIKQGYVIHFVNEMFKHYKPVAVANEAVDFLEVSMIGSAGPGSTNQETSSELGVVSVRNSADLNSFSQEFIKAIAKHRHWDRMDKSSNTPA